MKKTYMTPMMEAHTINTTVNILAGSGFSWDDGNGTGTGSLNDNEAESDALSRGTGFWGDDE